MAVTKFEGFPQSEGQRVGTVVAIDGPSSYATGGQTVTAASLGFKYILFLEAAASDTGTHVVQPVFPTKGPAASIKLLWTVVGTGAEVANTTNLSAKHVRVRALGM